MTIEELIVYGKKYLHKDEVKLLLASVIGLDFLSLQNHLDEIVNNEDVKKYKALIKARKDNIPLAYVLGNTNFYGLEINVNENVLIPRFETEELTENTIKLIKEKLRDKENIKILDLCTGSGAIGLRLKKEFPNSKVTLSDISMPALEVARENSNNLNLDVEIIQSDLFENINDKYDVIISNPPYIMDNEEIEEIVKNNEPSIALYAGKEGLDYYIRILKDIKNYLNDKYIVAFEIGCTQKEKIVKLIEQNLKDIEITCKKDLSEKDRMIFITKK